MDTRYFYLTNHVLHTHLMQSCRSPLLSNVISARGQSSCYCWVQPGWVWLMLKLKCSCLYLAIMLKQCCLSGGSWQTAGWNARCPRLSTVLWRCVARCVHTCLRPWCLSFNFIFPGPGFMFTYRLNINTLPVVKDLHIAGAVCWWGLQPSGSLPAPPPPPPELWVECRWRWCPQPCTLLVGPRPSDRSPQRPRCHSA